MKKTLKPMSATKLLSEVKRLQKEYPDAIYSLHGQPQCFYSRGRVINGPKTHGCIVGQAIRKLYPEHFTEIRKMDVDIADDSEIESEDGLSIFNLSLFYGGKSSKALDEIQAIQTNQDIGEKWGSC